MLENNRFNIQISSSSVTNLLPWLIPFHTLCLTVEIKELGTIRQIKSLVDELDFWIGHLNNRTFSLVLLTQKVEAESRVVM